MRTAQWDRPFPTSSRMPRRSVAGVLGPQRACGTTRSVPQAGCLRLSAHHIRRCACAPPFADSGPARCVPGHNAYRTTGVHWGIWMTLAPPMRPRPRKVLARPWPAPPPRHRCMRTPRDVLPPAAPASSAAGRRDVGACRVAKGHLAVSAKPGADGGAGQAAPNLSQAHLMSVIRCQ